MDPVLETLRRSAGPDECVRLHETGGARPPLEGITAVVFWLADPLREHFPACYEEAVAISEEARSRGIPIVNPPEALSNSIKSRQSGLWRAAGFETPRWARFHDDAELRAVAHGTAFPLLIRADEAHGHKRVRIVRDQAELATVDPASLQLPGSVAPLWDVRESYRARDPDGVYARYHHKKRIYVLGDRVRTEHVFFSGHPVVGAASCTFGRYHRLPSALHGLSRVRGRDRRAIEEDLAYWRSIEQDAEIMVRAARTLDFAFAAIDYSQRADGSVILWEANPHPILPDCRKVSLPRQRLAAERAASYQASIGDFLMGLARKQPLGGDFAQV